MKNYLRILGYLKPHAPIFVAAVVATLIFAGLDAFSFLLVIPFLNVLLTEPTGPRPEAISTGDEMLDRVLNGTIGRMVDLQAPPEEAIRGIIVFLLVAWGRWAGS